MQMFIRSAPLFTLALLVSCACPCKRAQTITLFNGKDLSGWRGVSADPAVKTEQVWSVQDSMIICKGEPMGYLHSETSFTDLILHAEYRWAPGKTPGNSGLFARINGEPRALPRCLETQLRPGDAGDLYCFHGMTLSGQTNRFRFVPKHELGGDLRGVKKIKANEKPAGEWNTVEVTLCKSNVSVRLNGATVNKASGVEIAAGPVGLQSEGGEIHFRNVWVRPLK